MIESMDFDYCSHCKTGDAHSHLAPIGNKVLVPGKSKSEYTFFQCSICGHIWQYIEDSGFGGHGHCYSLLTKP